MRHRRRVVLLVVGILLGVSACSSNSAETTTTSPLGAEPSPATSGDGRSGRRPVIVDYSPTVSDVGGLMYLLAHPDVEVLAVTVPVTGEAGCDLGVEVTRGILAMFEQVDIPVACDPEVPEGARPWPTEFVSGNQELTSGLPAAAAGASGATAADLIAETARTADRPVTIYAVAPLTNVARALEHHPDLATNLDQVVIMGGAVGVPGNVPGTDAEWNIWIDAPAAAAVFASDVPVTIVPLDATNDVPVPIWYEQALGEANQSDAIVYLARMVEAFPAVTSGFFYLWDELAASVVGGETMVAVEEMGLAVVDEEGPMYGSTVVDPSGRPVTVATAVGDPTGFTTHFISVLAGGPVDAPASTAVDAGSPPSTVLSTSVPEEVLAFWIFHALEGDIPSAASVVTAGADWIEGFGESPEAWIDGSEPYNAVDIEVFCAANGTFAGCYATWTDAWIAPIPDLALGRLRIEADVADGAIVAFRTLEFGGEVVTAFSDHLAWLEAERPEAFELECATDATLKSCSELLVATVMEWIADR